MILLEYKADMSAKNADGLTAWEAFHDDDKKNRFLTTSEFTFEVLAHNHYHLWFYLLNTEDCNDVSISDRVLSYVNQYPQLASASCKDSNGRLALDIAAAENRKVLMSATLVHGRFRLKDSRAEHASGI